MRVEADVLKVLGESSCSGTRLVLPPSLARPLYERVNKVLVACGGRWDKKAKAHVFEGDARQIVADVIVRGEVRTAREDDWFPTPAAVADRLVQLLTCSPFRTVLEPSAGEGALVLALDRAGLAVDVVCVEKDPGRCRKLCLLREVCSSVRVSAVIGHDFLSPEAGAGIGMEAPFDRVIANPPFSKNQAPAHLLRAYELLAPGGRLAAVAPVGVEYRSDRLHARFAELVEECGWTEPLPDGAFKDSGTNVRTVIAVLDKPAAR
jgi:type I restriction-modification system DNA methylase subunit